MKDNMSLKDMGGRKARKRVVRKPQQQLFELGQEVARMQIECEDSLDMYIPIEDEVRRRIDREYSVGELMQTIQRLADEELNRVKIGMYTGALASILTERGVEKIHLDGKGMKFNHLMMGARNLGELVIENFVGAHIGQDIARKPGKVGKIRIINCEGNHLLCNATRQHRNELGRIEELQIINHKGAYLSDQLRRVGTYFAANSDGNFGSNIGTGCGQWEKYSPQTPLTDKIIILNCKDSRNRYSPHSQFQNSGARKVILGRVGDSTDTIFPDLYNGSKLVLAYKTPGYEPKTYPDYSGKEIQPFKGYNGPEAIRKHLELTGIPFGDVVIRAEQMKHNMTTQEIMERADWIIGLYNGTDA